SSFIGLSQTATDKHYTLSLRAALPIWKHLSRRTVLRGAGAAIGLPLLDAMIPAATALAKAEARPRLRVGFFYLPHGAIMANTPRSEEHTSELQSRENHVCRLLLEKKKI